MRLTYLLLILPAVSATSIKLTKRRLSDPLLERRHVQAARNIDTSSMIRTRPNKRDRGDKRSIPEPEILSSIAHDQSLIQTSTGSKRSASSSDALTSSSSSDLLRADEGAAGTSSSGGISSGSTSLGAASGGSQSSSQAPISTGSTGSSSTTLSISESTAESAQASAAASSTSASKTNPAIPIATDITLGPVDPWVYTIDVKFGTDPKPVPMLVDTGSFSFWAAAQSCTTCGDMVSALISDSSCIRPYDTSYGTGGFSGCIVNTTVEFGPYKMENVAIAAADTMEQDLAAHGGSFSGMFGLAMPGKGGTTTPMTQMLSDGLVDSPWVGLRLQRHDEGDSEMIFGDALLSDHGDPNFHVNLPGREDGKPQYNVTLESLDILGAKAPDSLIGGRGMLLDSGTSNIVVPESSYYKIMKSLSVEGKIPANPHDPTNKTSMLRCTVDTGADAALAFKFGGVAFPVPWKDIIGAEVDLKDFPEYNKPGIAKFCEPRLQMIKGSNDWILGNAFLVNVYHAINTQTGGVQMWRLRQ